MKFVDHEEADDATTEGGSGDDGELPAQDPDDVDVEVDGGEEAGPGDPRRFEQWMRRSTAGVLMTGIAVGLQEALELPRQNPPFVMKAPGEPDRPDGAIDIEFDPDHPERTVARIRPWLLGKKDAGGS